MEERKIVEKRAEVTRENTAEPKTRTTNVNIAPNGSTQVQEETEVVDEPVGSTVIRQEETIERDRA
jgi:hypothetical protein